MGDWIDYAQRSAQLRQGHAQLHQLSLVNWQLQQQQAAAAYHANVQQALFETEQRARRVAATVRHDTFAAAVLAHDWMPRIQSVGPASFTELGAKRAWVDAWNALDGAIRAARVDPRVGGDVDRYLAAMRQLTAYAREVGQDPAATAAQARAQAKALEPTVEGHVALAGLGLGVALFLPDAARPVGTLVFLFAFLPAYAWFDKRGRASVAHARAAHLERVAGDALDFKASAEGRFLEAAWASHPLLFEEPPAELAPASQGVSVQIHSERHLVERQVVVVRCRFCRNLSPVDRPTCEHCGAAGFGSSQ